MINHGQGWFEVVSAKMTNEERNTMLDPTAEEGMRLETRNRIEARASKMASEDDSKIASEILATRHPGSYSCAAVILPSGHGFVVHSQGWTRF
jgi:hypothetical protein